MPPIGPAAAGVGRDPVAVLPAEEPPTGRPTELPEEVPHAISTPLIARARTPRRPRAGKLAPVPGRSAPASRCNRSQTRDCRAVFAHDSGPISSRMSVPSRELLPILPTAPFASPNPTWPVSVSISTRLMSNVVAAEVADVRCPPGWEARSQVARTVVIFMARRAYDPRATEVNAPRAAAGRRGQSMPIAPQKMGSGCRRTPKRASTPARTCGRRRRRRERARRRGRRWPACDGWSEADRPLGLATGETGALDQPGRRELHAAVRLRPARHREAGRARVDGGERRRLDDADSGRRSRSSARSDRPHRAPWTWSGVPGSRSRAPRAARATWSPISPPRAISA